MNIRQRLGIWNKSLTNRVARTFIFPLFLAVILVGSIVYLQATRSLTESVYDRLSAVATLKRDSLIRWIDQQRLNIVFIAWQPEVKRQAEILLDGAETREDPSANRYLAEYLTSVVTRISDMNELMILDMNGKVALSTLPYHTRQDHSADLFYQEGFNSTYVQPVYESPETGLPTITVSTPVFNENGRRVGILVGHLNLARIDQIFTEQTGLGESGETYLVNPSNEFVSARPNDILIAAQPGTIRSKGIDAALQGENGQDMYENYLGIPVLGVYYWLGDQNMVLMAEMSRQEAFTPARQLALVAIEYGLLASAILVGVAFYTARRISKPILAITDTASRVALGDFSKSAPVLTDDEVGQLAHTFNDMTRQLQTLYQGLEQQVRERTQQLEQSNRLLEDEILERKQIENKLHVQNGYLAALHETALGMISHLEVQELFETLVIRAGQLMNAQGGLIYIHETGESEIECKVGVGVLSKLVGLRLSPGEGLGGTVWQTGKWLVVSDYDRWEGRARNIEFDLIRSIIGFPLKSGDQTAGVISLAYTHASGSQETFGEDEIELLSRFAQLASIALENARLYRVVTEAKRAAEEANESKSTFMANVSHELRTPLTSISGFTRIIQKRIQERILPILPVGDPTIDRTVAQIEKNLAIVLSEGDRLTYLINDLLDLEKIRAGKMVWRSEPVQIIEVVHQAAAATSSLLENKGLTWMEELPQDVPVIQGDPDRLMQVLINLISNAVKFTQHGSITCSVEISPAEIVVSIQDQGIGIASEDQALVFEKFRQLGDPLTSKPSGTGLGLPICKEIVEHHQGRMWVESELNAGSTFYFSLPVRSE
jgi:signal transduction histidine kinase/HAMP domain-containing protein